MKIEVDQRFVGSWSEAAQDCEREMNHGRGFALFLRNVKCVIMGSATVASEEQANS